MVNRLFLLLCCLVFGFQAFPQHQSKKGKIKIVISNLKNEKGKILMSLHNKKEGFPGDPAHTLISRELNINGDTVICEFAKIPPGEYAIAIIHDENSNYKLDTNMLGIPAEGIGISNNAYKMMGPPEYEDAKFELGTGEKVIHINMHYY